MPRWIFALTNLFRSCRRIFENECWDDSAKEGTLTYEGTGKVPQKLILRIIEEQEGDFDVNAALDAAEAIILSGQQEN